MKGLEQEISEQLESLKQLEYDGYIDLYYGDESHVGLTPNVPYAWQTKLNPAANGKFLTVVVLDNSPILKSKKFMSKIKEWKEQYLLIYFLPPYSPELNLI